MYKKRLISILLPIMVISISACGSSTEPTTNSTTTTSSTRDGVKASFKFSSTSSGATIVFENAQNTYYVGDTVNFKLDLKDGFELNQVTWNNNLLVAAEEEEYPFSFVAATTNNIKAQLITHFSIDGYITFNGESLTSNQAKAIGIQATNLENNEIKKGTVTYLSGQGAYYTIENVVLDARYSVDILIYLASNFGSPQVFSSSLVTTSEAQTTFNIDADTTRRFSDQNINFPVESGQIYNVYDIDNGWQADDYCVEITFSSHLSQLTSRDNKAVSSVFGFYGLTDGNADSGQAFAYRIMHEDTPRPGYTETPHYRLQICENPWTEFDLTQYWTTEQIENATKLSVVTSFTTTAMTTYFCVDGEYVKCFTYNVSWRQNVQYIDTNAWAADSISNTSVSNCEIIGGITSPADLSYTTRNTIK